MVGGRIFALGRMIPNDLQFVGLHIWGICIFWAFTVV